jgi:DNA-binding transcriptional ArsR family regulator
MRHLRVLEDAELLISRRDGRRRRLYHNAVPIQLIHDRWTTEYSALWSGRMAEVKYRVEAGVEAGGEAATRRTKRRRTG